MPLYNHEKYLKKSISTIVNQTYNKIELIIIDDGSTDNSSKIVKEFKDKRIKYIYQKNKGVKKLNTTINKGLKFAKGSLVTMVASDDYLPLNRFADQVRYFKNDKVDMVFGNITLVDENRKKIRVVKPNISKKYNLQSKRKKIRKYFENNYIPQPSTLIRMSALKKIGGYIQKKYMYAEDYPTQLSLMMNGDVIYINKNFSFYRLHATQMTRLHQDKMIESDIRYLKYFYKNLNRLKKKDTGFKNIKELNDYLKIKKMNLFFYIGFSKACIKQNVTAKKFFLKGVKAGTFFNRISCFIALFFLIINLDFNLLRNIKFFYENKKYKISNFFKKY